MRMATTWCNRGPMTSRVVVLDRWGFRFRKSCGWSVLSVVLFYEWARYTTRRSMVQECWQEQKRGPFRSTPKSAQRCTIKMWSLGSCTVRSKVSSNLTGCSSLDISVSHRTFLNSCPSLVILKYAGNVWCSLQTLHPLVIVNIINEAFNRFQNWIDIPIFVNSCYFRF